MLYIIVIYCSVLHGGCRIICIHLKHFIFSDVQIVKNLRIQFSFSVLRALISNTKNSNQTTPELLVKSSRTTKHAENTSPSSFNYLTSAFIALVPPCPHLIWLGLLIFMSHVERVAQEVFRSQWWCWRSQLFFFFGRPALIRGPNLGRFSCFSVCMDLLVTSPVIRVECFLQKRKKKTNSPLITLEL